MRRRTLLVALAVLAGVLVVTGTPVLAGLAAVVAAGAIVFALWPEPPSRITRENFDRMRRRKLLVALAGLAVVVAARAVALWPEPPPRIAQENFDRIRIGIMRADVAAILGPDGDFKTRDCKRRDLCAMISGEAVATVEMQTWDTDTGRIDVYYSRRGTVAWAMYSVNRLPEAGPVENFLSRARYLWRRWLP